MATRQAEVLARAVVEQLAPEELPFFSATCEAFFAAGGKRGRDGEDVLGFGLGEAIALIGPVALALASSAVFHLAGEAGKAVAQRGLDKIRGRRRKRLAGEASPDEGIELPELSAEQELELKTVLERRAKELGMAPESIDSVVAALLAAFRRDK